MLLSVVIVLRGVDGDVPRILPKIWYNNCTIPQRPPPVSIPIDKNTDFLSWSGSGQWIFLLGAYCRQYWNNFYHFLCCYENLYWVMMICHFQGSSGGINGRFGALEEYFQFNSITIDIVARVIATSCCWNITDLLRNKWPPTDFEFCKLSLLETLEQ